MFKLPKDIICDRYEMDAVQPCGGWHPTDRHGEHTREAIERTRRLVLARSDEVYRFNALGCRTSKIEPWMSTVVEKARELGDDLYDTDFYSHVGPLDPFQDEEWGNRETPGAIEMLVMPSFQENPWSGHHFFRDGGTDWPLDLSFMQHLRGRPVSSYGDNYFKNRRLLAAQERYVRNRTPQHLTAYIKAMRGLYISFVKRRLMDQGKEGRHYCEPGKRVVSCEFPGIDFQKIWEDFQRRFDLRAMEDRRAAIKFLMRSWWAKGKGVEGGRQGIGFIYKFSDALLKNPRYKIKRTYWGPGNERPIWWVGTAQGEGLILVKPYRDHMFPVAVNHEVQDLVTARQFFRDFLHGLFVPHGSIEEQRDLLERMLAMTAERPEHRLPIYNYYGKLVWPRPHAQSID